MAAFDGTHARELRERFVEAANYGSFDLLDPAKTVELKALVKQLLEEKAEAKINSPTATNETTAVASPAVSNG